MKVMDKFPLFGMCLLGLVAVSPVLGFVFEGMDDLFPFLMFGGLGGGQSNYINPPVQPQPPITQRPPVVKPPQSITWRWVPNFRPMWPQWSQYQQWQYPNYFYPGNIARTNSIVPQGAVNTVVPVNGVVPANGGLASGATTNWSTQHTTSKINNGKV